MPRKKQVPYNVIRKTVDQYVSEHINDHFYDRRTKKLKEQSAEELLKKLLRAKNPYMLRAVNCDTAEKLIRRIIGDNMSSSDEGMFGEFLEELAIEVSGIAIGGKKAAAEGIDIDADHDEKRYQIAVKSGRVWGNNQSINKQKQDFIFHSCSHRKTRYLQSPSDAAAMQSRWLRSVLQHLFMAAYNSSYPPRHSLLMYQSKDFK